MPYQDESTRVEADLVVSFKAIELELEEKFTYVC